MAAVATAGRLVFDNLWGRMKEGINTSGSLVILGVEATNRLIVDGKVVDVAHRTTNKNEVVVLAFVDQTFRQQGTKQIFASEEQRIRLNLQRSGSTWQVDLVEILSGQTAQ